MSGPRLSDLSGLTLDELWELLRDKVEALIREELGVAPESTEVPANDLEDFPVDSYGSWPENLSLRREDMYGSDER